MPAGSSLAPSYPCLQPPCRKNAGASAAACLLHPQVGLLLQLALHILQLGEALVRHALQLRRPAGRKAGRGRGGDQARGGVGRYGAERWYWGGVENASPARGSRPTGPRGRLPRLFCATARSPWQLRRSCSSLPDVWVCCKGGSGGRERRMDGGGDTGRHVTQLRTARVCARIVAGAHRLQLPGCPTNGPSTCCTCMGRHLRFANAGSWFPRRQPHAGRGVVPQLHARPGPQLPASLKGCPAQPGPWRPDGCSTPCPLPLPGRCAHLRVCAAQLRGEAVHPRAQLLQLPVRPGQPAVPLRQLALQRLCTRAGGDGARRAGRRF